MSHLISMEGNDVSWRGRCNERLERLKNTQFFPSQPTEVFEEQLVVEKKVMIFQLCTSIQNKNADRFVDKLEEISAESKLSLANILGQVTHTSNSLLHEAAHFGAEEIGELIAYHFPELLMKRNIRGDTPLHVAARAKNSNIVKMILSRYVALKAMLPNSTSEGVNSLANGDIELTRLKNEDGNTALHEAVYANHFETVSQLFEADKPVTHHLNKSNKSALYIAVVNSDKEIHDLLLQAPIVDKPPPKCHGISPLHAAISKKDSALLADILENNVELMYLRDEYGGTLLHYAASTNYLAGIRILLEKCSLLALEYNTKGQLPIHIACKMGHVGVIKEMLKQGPNVRDFLNHKFQNILHVAAKSGKDKVVKFLLEKARLEDFTINERDKNGNTALHLATKQFYPNVLIHLVQDERFDVNIKNNDDFTARDLVRLHCTIPMMRYREFLVSQILICAGSELSDKGRSIRRRHQRQALLQVNSIKNGVKTCILIAILIATVTFAAGFTVPGGVYSSDDPNHKIRGTAVLVNKPQFLGFTVFNTAAMFGSTIGCTILLGALLAGDPQIVLILLLLGSLSVGAALWTMYAAFVLATSLVVSKELFLAVILDLCMIGLVLLVIVLVVLVAILVMLPRIRRLRRLSYFLFNWIYMIPFLGRYEKNENTDSQLVHMEEEKNEISTS